MKKVLLVISCLLLFSCSEKKTRGLTMEISLEATENVVWRCQSDNLEIIKITEENFLTSKTNEFEGQYQFRFAGVSEGKTTITCIYMELDNNVEEMNTYYVEVNKNKIIKYVKKEGNSLEKLSEPVFR